MKYLLPLVQVEVDGTALATAEATGTVDAAASVNTGSTEEWLTAGGEGFSSFMVGTVWDDADIFE